MPAANRHRADQAITAPMPEGITRSRPELGGTDLRLWAAGGRSALLGDRDDRCRSGGTQFDAVLGQGAGCVTVDQFGDPGDAGVDHRADAGVAVEEGAGAVLERQAAPRVTVQDVDDDAPAAHEFDAGGDLAGGVSPRGSQRREFSPEYNDEAVKLLINKLLINAGWRGGLVVGQRWNGSGRCRDQTYAATAAGLSAPCWACSRLRCGTAVLLTGQDWCHLRRGRSARGAWPILRRGAPG
jgi:hypothetical protein